MNYCKREEWLHKTRGKSRHRRLAVAVSSAGKLDAYDLVSRKCNVSVSSAGHAKINVVEELDAEASSAGSITYTGDPKEIRIEKSSAGSVSKR